MLIGLVKGNDTLRFSYDAAGNAAAVDHNGTYYYCLRNGQGDIVKLIDGSGNTVVEYAYDSWGKQLSCTGTLATTLGVLNPFRYRGYVYDEETGFYYLKSRYYDPETCRFISADVLLSTGQGVIGHNCYAYCLNKPINLKDEGGSSARDLSLVSEEGGGIVVLHYSSPRYYGYGEEEQALIAFFRGYNVYYRDVKLVWINRPFRSSCSFLGKIHIYKGQSFNSTDMKHEYGHIIQEKQLGAIKYTRWIAIPSAWNCMTKKMTDSEYYSQPWEYIADILGGVDRVRIDADFKYLPGAKERAEEYLKDMLDGEVW